MGDEERTGEGRDVAVDDGELGVLLSLSERRWCCVDCHPLTSWDQAEGGVRRVLDRGVSFGVRGSGENDADDMASGEDSSPFANVEDIERTESAVAAGCWVRCGWSAVDADEDRFRLTDGVESNEAIIGCVQVAKGNAVEVEGKKRRLYGTVAVGIAKGI